MRSRGGARRLAAQVALALSWQRASSSLFPHSTTVTDFPSDAFESLVVADSRIWFVDYYAEWCSHCQVFAPVWEQIADEWQDEKRVKFGAVNCAVYLAFCEKQGVMAYPTLRAYHLPDSAASETKRGLDFPASPIKSQVAAWISKQLAKLPHVAPGHATAKIFQPQRGSSHVELAASAASARLRLIDAEVAVLYSMRQGVFLHAVNGHLDTHGMSDLLAWLSFLAVSLPSSRACKDLLRLVGIVNQTQQDAGGVLDHTSWIDILDGWSLDGLAPAVGLDPEPHWRACGSYTCGLWNLFHIVTTAPRTTSGISTGPERAPLQNVTTDSLAMVRVFVARFFGCKDCADNFLETYDSCAFGRCDLKQEDQKGAALWLWRVHNEVTQRVAKEKGKAAPAAWPPVGDCAACWPNAAAAAESVSTAQLGETSAVYSYLQQSYWQPMDQVQEGAGFLSADTLVKWLAVIACVCVLVPAMIAVMSRFSKQPRSVSKADDVGSQGESFLGLEMPKTE